MSAARIDAATRPVIMLLEAELEALIEHSVVRALQRHSATASVATTPDPLCLMAEVRARLHCGRGKVNRLIREGRLRAVKLETGGSSRVMISRESLERLLAECGV